MIRIKELRKARDWKQDDLARELQVGRQTVGNYETGFRSPDVDTILRLCEIFGCSADYLLGRSDLPDPHLSDDESALLQRYRDLSETGREYVRHSLAPASLAHSGKNRAVSDVEVSDA